MGSPYVVRDALVPVSIFIDLSHPDIPRVLSDEEVAKLDQANLPANIKKETSQWRRPNWMLATLINSNSYLVDPKAGTQRFDMTKFAQARIRCLLVDWSMKDSDPTLTLERIAAPELPNVLLLTDKTMAVIGTIHDEVVNAFYRTAMNVLYPTTTEEDKKEAVEAPKN